MKKFNSFLKETINTSHQDLAVDKNTNMSALGDPSVRKKLNAREARTCVECIHINTIKLHNYCPVVALIVSYACSRGWGRLSTEVFP